MTREIKAFMEGSSVVFGRPIRQARLEDVRNGIVRPGMKNLPFPMRCLVFAMDEVSESQRDDVRKLIELYAALANDGGVGSRSAEEIAKEINRLSKYLRSDDNRVRFVNAQNPHDLQAVANFLNVEGNTFLSPKDFSRPDCDMQLADLYQHLKGMSGVAVLRGFTAQAALLGSAELRQMLKTLAGLTFSDCKVIVLCYQCGEALLLEMGLGEHVELFNYLNLIGMHAEHAIHYLTNNTLVERQKILTLLSTYAYERNEIRSILGRIDPDLAMYLSVYPFKEGNWLEQYFEEYRYSKITNRISEQLTQMAQQQAIDRQYNLLQPRTSLLPGMIQDETFVYWIDAMGVEFLPYIREKCKAHGMRLQATICCSNLPTLTSTNREFWDEISASQKAKIEELDGIKHHGLEDYDYRKSKFPIYLCRELEIIDEVLLKAQKKLLSDACKNVLLVSDHGATRMAVIKEEDIPLDVNSKGIHGGRVCEYTDEIAQIPCAVREGEWYVLANYDRFKGGQRGSVEVHGGATLEEVVVPIIRLSLQAEEIEIRMTTPSPIEFSYKQLPVLGLYSSRPLEHARILLNNQWIDAQPGDDGQNFSFILPKKKASYDVTLYDGDEEIPGRIKVTVKNKVGSTNQNMGGIL